MQIAKAKQANLALAQAWPKSAAPAIVLKTLKSLTDHFKADAVGIAICGVSFTLEVRRNREIRWIILYPTIPCFCEFHRKQC
jgi:hypothetical protein